MMDDWRREKREEMREKKVSEMKNAKEISPYIVIATGLFFKKTVDI